MPKGKKGGKKGKKGKKSKKEPTSTPEEEIWKYKIGIKESELQEIRYQLKEQEEQKKRNFERNEALANEREQFMQLLLHKVQESEKLESERFVDKPEVVAVMKENWALEQQEQEAIRRLEKEIAATDAAIFGTRSEIGVWKDFRDKGQHEQSRNVRLLRQEIRDIDETFKSMCEYMERKLRQDKQRIQTVTDSALETQKTRATDTAVQQLDKNSKQELVDNDWLKEEAQIHRREMDTVLSQVEELERRNLQVMSELFECRVQDLRFSRDFFMTQFKDDDDLGETGLLELDLDEVLAAGAKDRQARPKTAEQLELEDKFLRLTRHLSASSAGRRGAEDEDDNDEEEDEDEEYDTAVGTDEDLLELLEEMGEDGRVLGQLMNVGPLEVKLLSVTGAQARLHTPALPSAEELEAKQWNPDVWPVSRRMLHTIKDEQAAS